MVRLSVPWRQARRGPAAGMTQHVGMNGKVELPHFPGAFDDFHRVVVENIPPFARENQRRPFDSRFKAHVATGPARRWAGWLESTIPFHAA